MASAAASDTSPADVIGAFVAEVEAHAAHRLATAPRMAVGVESGVGSTSSSSNRTTSPFAPPPTPPLSPMPLPLAAFAIDSSQSLAINLMQLLEYRLRRPPPGMLIPADRTSFTAAFNEGLRFLMPNDTAARRHDLLASNVLSALTHEGAAWLWASTIEATNDQEVASVSAMASHIINSCSATAASLFADAELQAALGM